MTKLEEAIDHIEKTAAVSDYRLVAKALTLLRAHQQESLCFEQQFAELTEALTKMRSRCQRCPAAIG